MYSPVRCAALLLLLPASFALTQQSSTPAPSSAPATQPSAPATSAPATQDVPDSPGAQVQAAPQPTGPTVVMDTTMGRITCRLFDKQAPQTTANFIGLADGTKDWTDPTSHGKMHGKSLYNNTQFHRVIPGFMIQGGDPAATGMGDPGYYIPDEIDPALTFDVAGRLAMANSGPNTDGSQFFVTDAPAPHLDGHYTIFGQCDDPSVTVVKTIEDVPRDPQDKPLEPVILKKVTIVAAGQPVPPAPSQAAESGSKPSAPAADAPKP
jgi:peptidyl-prolyl cis-trans isomerase A (cyclophilin A)